MTIHLDASGVATYNNNGEYRLAIGVTWSEILKAVAEVDADRTGLWTLSYQLDEER